MSDGHGRHEWIRITEADGDVTLRDGQPTLVHDVCVANRSGGGITQLFTEGASSGGNINNVIMTITVPAGESLVHGHELFAEHGFRIAQPAPDVEVTINYRDHV